MAKTWICGDTHGHIDLRKLEADVWPEGSEGGEGNILIVAGDLGVHWSPIGDEGEQSLMQYWAEKPFTTLWIDGNHDNHETIKLLPRKDLKEIEGLDVIPLALTPSTLGYSGYNLYHLYRGGIYRINGLNTFCMGGGASIDKNRRVTGVSWWPEEIPSSREMQFGLDNLDNFYHKYPGEKIHVVVTHTIPFFLRRSEVFMRAMARNFSDHQDLRIGYKGKEEMGLQMMLEEAAHKIVAKQESVEWFFGHWHKHTNIEMEYEGQTIHFKCRYNREPSLITKGGNR